ncbi:MAG TPA: ABC transporter permease subunit [Paracoccaceae bacterium]|nr:ABC transporter permease subunit [Paracoccaceae bacterium]
MTVAISVSPARAGAPLVWGLALAAAWTLTLALPALWPALAVWPRADIIPFARAIGEAVKWLLNDASFGLFTFRDLTRAMAAALDAPYRVALGLLSTGLGPLPPLGWAALTGLAAIIGHALGGLRLALLAAACLIFVAAFGRWGSAMVTLASVVVAVPVGVAGGLMLGIAGHRRPWLGRALTPVLDLMQTVPVFAYLVPVLILFGFGPVAAIVATVVYALPPMTRVTLLALSRTPPELLDLARMTGCTPRQTTWRILVPAAREALMTGVNQVIMLTLNMVIIASMIGAGGLGFDVLTALRRLDFGAGLEAGLAIVALAVLLDRLSQAAALRAAAPRAPRRAGLAARHPHLLAALGWVALCLVLAPLLPGLRDWPAALTLSTGAFFGDVVAAINTRWFDTIEAVKSALLINVMVPFKRFLVGLPWAAVAAFLAFAGWRLGGWRLGLTCGGLTAAIAAAGLWEPAMTTVYLCGLSVVFAMAIGLPLGVLAAERPALWPPLRAAIDTAQTLPSFVYLMPAVMLFRGGGFTAMVAVVAYALAPAIRYTVLGLNGVDPRLVEAGRAMGCSRAQILVRIKLRLALPEILLGLNQTVMFALSMLVITALVGTRDLGQEVYVALTKADAGRGLVAGLAVAFIAIIADRLIGAAARDARARLGLAGGRA